MASQPWDLYALLVILAEALAFCVAAASRKMLVTDELLGLPWIRQPGLMAMIHYERTTPIWLDPMAFPLLVHGVRAMLGQGGVALRLVSIGSIMILLAALFFLVREIAGRRAAVVVPILVCMLPVFEFGWQQRPYALVLAMVAVAALCWYKATHGAENGRVPRGMWLAGLALSLGVALNSHFYVVFALIPFFAAEAVRTLQRRRVDRAVVGALAAGSAMMLLTVPFVHAIRQYGSHILTGRVEWLQIVQTYVLTLNGAAVLDAQPHGVAVYAVVSVGVVLVGFWIVLRGRRERPLGTLIAGLILSPVAAVAFAIYILHAYRDRYALYEFVGLMLGVGILVSVFLNRMSRAVYVTMVGVLCLLCARHQMHLWRRLSQEHAAEVAALGVPPKVSAMLRDDPSTAIFAPVESCLHEAFYGSPAVQARLICVYSAEREIRYGGTDTVARTAAALAGEPGFRVESYEAMLATPGRRLVVLRPEVWEGWIAASLQADGVRLRPVGSGLTGEVFAMSERR